jgi:thiamine-phosphate pyrophosphorylase
MTKQALLAQLRGLYAITDTALAQPHDLLVMVESALRGGARVIQFRDKISTSSQRLATATALKALCSKYHALFLINDDVALALAVDADGVHLGQTDMALTAARAQLGAAKIIGVSCHNDLSLAATAIQQTADYIALGRFFPSRSKPQAPAAALSILREARQQLSAPLVAIGGVTPDNALALIAAGADMVAAIHGVFGQRDIEAAARAYTGLFSNIRRID